MISESEKMTGDIRKVVDNFPVRVVVEYIGGHPQAYAKSVMDAIKHHICDIYELTIEFLSDGAKPTLLDYYYCSHIRYLLDEILYIRSHPNNIEEVCNIVHEINEENEFLQSTMRSNFYYLEYTLEEVEFEELDKNDILKEMNRTKHLSKIKFERPDTFYPSRISH